MILDNFFARSKHLQLHLTSHQAALLSKPSDIFYFTGFLSLVPEEREAYLLVTHSTIELLHTAFSPLIKIPGFNYHPYASLTAITTKVQALTKQSISELLVDTSNLFVHEYQSLQTIPALTLQPLSKEIIWQLRQVKDSEEQAMIAQAAQLSQAAYQFARSHLTEGATEQQIAWKIESFIKEQGGQLAFPTIVAFGAHTASPHHQPTTTKLKQNTPVLMDLGAKVDGYCADMTRTIWYGNTPTPLFNSIEKIVRESYLAALQSIRNNPTSTTAAVLDAAARTSIETAGYGDKFIHTTGHGVGLEIHESPSLYKHTTTTLEPGTVITIEPGIYLSGVFGYRYENTILLTSTGPVELTQTLANDN